MADGWVSIHRQVTDNWIWKDKPFAKGQAWIDILLRVNHKQSEISIGNQVIKLEKGETVWSILDMSERWGWSRKKVDNFLNVLEKEQMLHNKRTTKYTILTVANWESYQHQEQQKNNKSTSMEHQKNTNNNVNNEEQVKHIRSFLPLDMTKSAVTAKKKIPNLITKYGYETVIELIKRYVDDVEEKRKGFKELKYCGEERFWNGKCLDFLEVETKKPIVIDMSDNDQVNYMLRGGS